MSTTFGVKIESTGEVIEIARRVGSEIAFTNPLAELLDGGTILEAMDNTHQGIFTISDIKDHIKKTLFKNNIKLNY